MSQYALPQLPFMPFGGGPGSVAGSDYGAHMQMPPMPYQNTGSMYGMMPPVMPMAPRNTVMTNLNMFGYDTVSMMGKGGMGGVGGMSSVRSATKREGPTPLESQ